MAAALDEAARTLLTTAGSFATVATLNSNGGPQASVVWILRTATPCYFSITTRRKMLNLTRTRGSA